MDDQLSITRRGLITAAAAAAFATSAGAAGASTPASPGGRTGPARRFAGRVVLVTGATSGIGRAAAEAFAREGARVLFNGRRAHLGAEVEANIQASGGEAVYRRGDVRDPAQVEAFVADALGRWGRVDVLYNNAGIFMIPGEAQDTAIADDPDATRSGRRARAAECANHDDIMRTNVWGTFHGMQHALPAMRAGGGGAIVSLASMGGEPWRVNTAPHDSHTRPVLRMTKMFARANAAHDIRVNALCPLVVDTPRLRLDLAERGLDCDATAGSAAPRIVTVDAMARAVMVLADERATTITGATFDLAGGRLA